MNTGLRKSKGKVRFKTTDPAERPIRINKAKKAIKRKEKHWSKDYLKTVIVTEEILEQGVSINGSWSLRQLRLLLTKNEFKGKKGSWPRKGWKQRVIGTKISKAQLDKFIALKNSHIKMKDIFLEEEARSHISSINQEILASKTKFDCKKCIHGKTESCTDRPANGCTYFYNALTDEHGPAYAA